ncbi:MAG TPA: fatty acyl-AMP ligase, partial [Thermoanaerobaculia bacterium]|nr:fatty acyl-AMP ligase [Thermoanaerobaculia bacterium]
MIQDVPSTVRGAASFVELLRARAADRPVAPLYTFLAGGEEEAGTLGAAGLDLRARGLAATLQQSGAAGERALLLFPPGLDFITAFFGCLYAGAVAVPAYPPRAERIDPRLEEIVRDCRPRFVLTTAAILARLRSRGAGTDLGGLQDARWIAIDEAGTTGDSDAAEWQEPELGPESLAFLQYTSGSISAPKGVMVTHGNLLHNEGLIRRAFRQTESSVVVGWLPLYHDMGLIGNVLQPLYSGGQAVLMSPWAFLQSPARWLRAISRYRATTSGGPDFAYDLCTRRVRPEQRTGLDLSSWEVAFNGAEPVRAETLERFAAAFAPYGFRRDAFQPCYGLAEATLLVSAGATGGGGGPVVLPVNPLALERGVAVESDGPAGRRLVGCGRPGEEVRVVNPETAVPLGDGAVGEIWVAGPSVAAGYWERPGASAETFGARLAGEEGPPFLRTGDLGFLAVGELYVTGRIKDLIIVRGRNLYPQDIERTAEGAHRALRPGGGAAFSVEVDGEERLVVAAEVERRSESEAPRAAAAVRRAVVEEHEVQVHEVVLLAAGTLPRTSSGKVRRGACRAAYLAGGGLEVVGRSAPAGSLGEVEEDLPGL